MQGTSRAGGCLMTMTPMRRHVASVCCLALLLVAAAAVLLPRLASRNAPPVARAADKIYVAEEGDGTVAVIDAQSRQVVKRIGLETKQSGYMPHNVQVAPDGKTVWVTANAMTPEEEGGGMRMKVAQGEAMDQVIVIDAERDEVVKRIDMGSDLHLSHVAVAPDGSFAVVAAQERGMIYGIDARTLEVVRNVETGALAQPHGLRIAPDGTQAFIAMLGGKSLGILDLKGFALSYVPLSGAAVQVAVTPDGAYALVTLYDSKSVALYDRRTGELSYVRLPEGAKGPVQLYPTPDSKYAYVADQGYYFDQPTGNAVYKIGLAAKGVVATIPAGSAPHGVVVSKDGRYAYVTNLLGNDVSVIDTLQDKEIARIAVGKQPNGISVKSAEGGTP